MKGSGFVKQKKQDLQKARIFLFVDSLCTFSNHESESSFSDIYPDELELKKKNEDSCKISFLDLSKSKKFMLRWCRA